MIFLYVKKIFILFDIRYDGNGRLKLIVAGDRLTEYQYTDGHISYIEHSRDGISVKTSYHFIKEKITFRERI